MGKYGVAFAGFRHGHIYGLYNLVKNSQTVDLIGAWEEDAQSIEKAEGNGVEFTYASYEDLLQDERVAIVAIGNYYGVRGKMVIDALKAGKHVIADKPLCTKLEEAEEIDRISKEKNLKVGLMLDMRYNKNVLRAMKIIEDGTIGEINNIYFGGQHPLMYGLRPWWYFEEGKHGGTINDIAIHGIDLVHMFTKSNIKEIKSARCWNCFAKEKPNFEDSAQFMLELESGAGVIADVSYSAPNRLGFLMPTYWEFKIWGTQGMISFYASSDGVDLYSIDADEVKNFEGIEQDKNYFDDFLFDIENGSFSNTDSIIKSTMATLEIQAKA